MKTFCGLFATGPTLTLVGDLKLLLGGNLGNRPRRRVGLSCPGDEPQAVYKARPCSGQSDDPNKETSKANKGGCHVSNKSANTNVIVLKQELPYGQGRQESYASHAGKNHPTPLVGVNLGPCQKHGQVGN